MSDLVPKKSNLVQLVDEQDQPSGVADVISAHSGEGLLHRAISVFLFRKTQSGRVQLLLQQRSKEKIVGASLWANTVCGNVLPDESYIDCANRRLLAELGIDGVTLTPIAKFRYQVACEDGFSENELDTVFAGWFDGVVSPNALEVQSTVWIDWSDDGIEANEMKLAPWFPLLLADNQVFSELQEFVSKKESYATR